MDTQEKKGVSRTLIAALVGALVALVISPFSQTLTFHLNKYLSRPILSIEYIEVLQMSIPIKTPTKEIQRLIQSDGYQALMMKTGSSISNLMIYQGSEYLSSNDDLNALKKAVGNYTTFSSKRINQLLPLIKALKKETTDPEIRSIAAKYYSQMDQYIANSQDTEILRESLLPMIEREVEVLQNSEDLVDQLESAIEQLSKQSKGNGTFRMRISVLNKGNTDGLVRNVGEIIFGPNKEKVSLKRASPPKPKNQHMLAMAVPVTVTNPEPEVLRKSAVGKVERNTMAEFWFEIDASESGEKAITQLFKQMRNKTFNNYSVILFDQDNESLIYRLEQDN
ncbi:MAG: hypothetical protein ACE5GU_09050 [Candidatus Scalinduaceae bacterium]